MSLEAAGYLAPEFRTYLKDIEAKMRTWGLESEFRYHGELDRAAKERSCAASTFSHCRPAYDEPKGLSVLEAMGCGVPVVQPRRGAFIEVLQKTGGGLLVPPDDPGALADALASILPIPRTPPSAASRVSAVTTRSRGWPTAPRGLQRGRGPGGDQDRIDAAC